MTRLSLIFALLIASPAAAGLGNLAKYPPTEIVLTITTTSDAAPKSNRPKFSFERKILSFDD